MYEICLLIDIYTNYICVIIGYSIFTEWYLKICSGLDSKCRDFCGRITGIDVNEAKIAKDLQISDGVPPDGTPRSDLDLGSGPILMSNTRGNIQIVIK